MPPARGAPAAPAPAPGAAPADAAAALPAPASATTSTSTSTSASIDTPADAAPRPPGERAVLARVVRYLWDYRARVAAALALMVAAKVANVGVPLVLKALVDRMTPTPGQAVLVVPAALLVAYGLLRLSSSLFTELRELVFVRATQGATRRMALQAFDHLHALGLRFHLARQTGGMTRDIERGVKGIESLVSYSLYSIVPTLVEMALVLGILASKFDAGFAAIAAVALAAYIAFTLRVTAWRARFRREVNALDSAAHARAVDSLLNYETVKYFNREADEAQRYGESLQRLHAARARAQGTLSALNTGQQLVIGCALVAMLWRATQGVAAGCMTLGDLVMVNAFMLQLYVPLNFLGVIYREIKQSVADLERLFALLDTAPEVRDAPGAPPLALPPGGVAVRFEQVDFAYDPARPILHGVDFAIAPGHTVAVVGPSGAGKSTLARLLYRFYDVTGGSVSVAGQDVRAVQQASLRAAIGIVPQDTVLFNDTIGFNIGYGRAGATQAEIEAAARAARIHDFIAGLPQGYATPVGERGLKLSGGEKQRVAIARALLKDPPVLIFDEATSALDSASERAIQAELRAAATGKTVLIVAHRLSTIAHADEILVLEAGRITERGRHAALLAAGGTYARMWRLQQGGAHAAPDDSPAPAVPDVPAVPDMAAAVVGGSASPSPHTPSGLPPTHPTAP